MKSLPRAKHFAAGLAVAFFIARFVQAQPPSATNPQANPNTPATAAPRDGKEPVSVEVARDRAELMHRIYAASLEMMHDHYFHGDRAMVPARAMEDVFEELDRQTNVQSRWIAVNTKAMSLDHEPETEFEKQAAREIAAGKEALEQVDQGFYRRAAVIPLSQGCVGCHTGSFGKPTEKPRFAGLVISVPVTQK